MHEYQLSGKFFIKYDPSNFNYKEILKYLITLEKSLIKLDLKRDKQYIYISNHIHKNSYYINSKCNYLFINSLSTSFEKISKKPDEFKLFFDFFISNIKHLLFFKQTDTRWRNLEHTAATLFLGSSLVQNGFSFSFEKKDFDSKQIIYNEDLLCLTIFEDLFFDYKNFLKSNIVDFQGIIAAGGPMITLHPLASVFYFENINLFIRGEGEIALPQALKAINSKNHENLFLINGLFFHYKNQIIISDFDKTNTLSDLNNISIDFSFFKPKQISKGLELNLSRGCTKKCIFCSKIQGSLFRKLPVQVFKNLLAQFTESFSNLPTFNKTININDDDILSDLQYSKKIFNEIYEYQYQLWGIQSSIDSFFKKSKVNQNVINLIKQKEIFVDSKPLLWLGTDSFLKKRSKILNKFIPQSDEFERLIDIFEKSEIFNYHYWISSDYMTDWPTFVDEFILIFHYLTKYKFFQILAHAPFLIPYSTTPLFKKIYQTENSNQIVFNKVPKTPFNFISVRCVKTKFQNLNNLLENQKFKNNCGFFDFLSSRDFLNCFLAIFHYLKQDRFLLNTRITSEETERSFKKLENRVEKIISELI